MSNLTHGMNLKEVEELGHALKERAKAISAIAGQIDRRVHSTTWAGPDAERFRGSWWPTHKAKLYATAKELDGLGQSALNNAGEQRTASAEPRSGVSGSSGGEASHLPAHLNAAPYLTPKSPETSPGQPIDYEKIRKILDTAEDAKFIMDTYGLTKGELDEAARLLKEGGFVSTKYVPVVGTLLSIGMTGGDIALNRHLYGGGASRTLWSEFDGTVGILLTPIPFGGVAWTCSTKVGEVVGNTAPVQDWSANVYEGSKNAIANRYFGGDYRSLSIDAQARVDTVMVERYSGWSGLRNFLWDAAS